MGKKADNPVSPEPAKEDGGPYPGGPYPVPENPQPGEPAPAAEVVPPAPEGDQPPPTWAELNAMAEMLERFGRRLLLVEDRAAKMAMVLRENYGVRL